jgi:phosphohistidine phosphatase
VNLYLIRHADALALGERGITDDADRPLSEEGEAQAKAVAAGLQRHGVHLELVVSSPLLRARQTAERMLREWAAPAPELSLCDGLGPGGKRRKLARFLRGLTRSELALVGHQPDLGEFTGWLIGSKKAQIDLAKAGVACVRCDDGPRKGDGRLLWVVPPEWFDAGPPRIVTG